MKCVMEQERGKPRTYSIFPNKLFHQRNFFFLLSRNMLISPQSFLEKIDRIKLYCCCFHIIMLESRKPIIKVFINLSQCIYHFSSSSGIYPSHLDRKAARLVEHFQQHKMPFILLLRTERGFQGAVVPCITSKKKHSKWYFLFVAVWDIP